MAISIDVGRELSSFGPRLRSMRDERRWTLEDLATRSGFSKPFLSRLEVGDRQPSIAAVLTLAKVFGVSVGALLDSVPPSRDACIVVRAGESTTREGDGIRYAPLSNAERFVNLQPIRLTVAHGRRGDERFEHDGEEWLYVLDGRLRVSVADQDYELSPGDAAHFDSRRPHRLTALDGRDAEVIVVSCPISEPDLLTSSPTARAARSARRPRTARAIAGS